MAKIEVKDINFDGSELFADSEGFMNELNEESIDGVDGGMLASPIPIIKTVPMYPVITPFPNPFPHPCPWTPVIL